MCETHFLGMTAMDIWNWILLSIGGLCFALMLFLVWLGSPSRHPDLRSKPRSIPARPRGRVRVDGLNLPDRNIRVDLGRDVRGVTE
jgi:hypothetical protein